MFCNKYKILPEELNQKFGGFHFQLGVDECEITQTNQNYSLFNGASFILVDIRECKIQISNVERKTKGKPAVEYLQQENEKENKIIKTTSHYRLI